MFSCATLNARVPTCMVRAITQPHLIEQVPRDILAWNRRAPQLLEEILDSNSDLIALQEVNRYGMATSC